MDHIWYAPPMQHIFVETFMPCAECLASGPEGNVEFLIAARLG